MSHVAKRKNIEGKEIDNEFVPRGYDFYDPKIIFETVGSSKINSTHLIVKKYSTLKTLASEEGLEYKHKFRLPEYFPLIYVGAAVIPGTKFFTVATHDDKDNCFLTVYSFSDVGDDKYQESGSGSTILVEKTGKMRDP